MTFEKRSDELRETCLEIIKQHSVFPSRMDRNARLSDDLGIDSLSLFNVIGDLERQLEIKIDDSKLNETNTRTVKSFVNFLVSEFG